MPRAIDRITPDFFAPVVDQREALVRANKKEMQVAWKQVSTGVPFLELRISCDFLPEPVVIISAIHKLDFAAHFVHCIGLDETLSLPYANITNIVVVEPPFTAIAENAGERIAQALMEQAGRDRLEDNKRDTRDYVPRWHDPSVRGAVRTALQAIRALGR